MLVSLLYESIIYIISRWNINYYDDQLILQSLQILLSNYINTYLLAIQNNSDDLEQKWFRILHQFDSFH